MIDANVCVSVCVCVFLYRNTLLSQYLKDHIMSAVHASKVYYAWVGIAVFIFAEKRTENIFSGNVTLVSRGNM